MRVSIIMSLNEQENACGQLNIVLIGMPGCGKTTIGGIISEMSGMPLIDIDTEVENSTGVTVQQLIAEYGEKYFRKLESTETVKAGKLSGVIIATGGGVVKNSENLDALAENGRIYYLRRSLSELSILGRPLSKDRDTVLQLYKERNLLYLKFCDCIAQEGEPISGAESIWSDFKEYRGRTNK